MKLKLFLVSLAVACLLVPQYAGASTVLEEAGWLFGPSGKNYRFVADQTPLVYRVTLTDFFEPIAPFDILSVFITTSTDNVAELLAPGKTTFDVELGTTYFANVLGLPYAVDEEGGVGLFGLEIKAVPIPPGFILLGSSVLVLVFLRRRV
jgi:hypothetical protein